MKKATKKKVVKHLKEDIKTFEKEEHDDKKLIKELKGNKMKKTIKKKK